MTEGPAYQPSLFEGAFDVRVVRSKRRKRSVAARLDGRLITVTIPAWMSKHEEDESVREMIKRFERKTATMSVDLVERARKLATAYRLPEPASIEWADDLTAGWGLCTPSTAHVRVSARLVGFPMWVLDYVIVHELAHLVVDRHDAEFWKVVNRYPKAERAIGYLIAKSGSDDDQC